MTFMLNFSFGTAESAQRANVAIDMIRKRRLRAIHLYHITTPSLPEALGLYWSTRKPTLKKVTRVFVCVQERYNEEREREKEGALV